MAEEEREKRGRRAPMNWEEGKKFVLGLPEGYSIRRKDADRVQITWEKTDPPVPLGYDKYYGIIKEGLTDQEIETLKDIYANKKILSLAQELAQVQTQKIMQEVAGVKRDLSSLEVEVDKQLRPTLNKIETAVEELKTMVSELSSSQSSPSTAGSSQNLEARNTVEETGREPKKPSRSIVIELDKWLSEQEYTVADYARIGRYVATNPIIATYFAVFRERYSYQGSLEQFLTDCVRKLFTIYGLSLVLLETD